MADEKLSWKQHIHFIENSSKMPINLSKSIPGAFMTCVWDLLHIFRKKYNLKGHCQVLFMVLIYFLISIVCKALFGVGKCILALLHLADSDFLNFSPIF